MKVALINTSEYTGGAAIACKRLFEAHKSQGVDVYHVVLHARANTEAVMIGNGGRLARLNLYKEKLKFYFQEKSSAYRFRFSSATFGTDISKLRAVQQADIVHLHWVQQGFLSLKNIQALIDLGKPIFWTMHDMWTFTGGCHYVEHCTNYLEKCGNCFMLKRPAKGDLSNSLWLKKEKLYKDSNITFVTCSAWLKEIAKKSKLLMDQRVLNIPNPIDIDFFRPTERPKGDKYAILIQAMDLHDKRKGFEYFVAALRILKERDPKITEKVKVHCFGKSSNESIMEMGFDVHAYGFLHSKDEILNAYQQSDLLVIPSLQDNLPNAVMESMACGLPVVGFRTGGIPEMVDHLKNGYLTEKKNAEGLADGLLWLIEDGKKYTELSVNARQKVQSSYSYEVISKRYVEQYLTMKSS